MSQRGGRFDQLSPEKRALLSLRLKKKRAAEAAQRPQLTRREDPGPPLSFSQERLWFLDQLESGAAYNDHLALRLTGDLDVHRLAVSLSAIAERHESMRARFQEVEGEPKVSFEEPARAPLPVVDLRARGEADAAASEVPVSEVLASEVLASELLAAAAARPFDLAVAPLWRCLLIRLAPRRHLLMMSMHHIITDGWSWGVILGELRAHYAAGGRSPLPPLAVQYGDYARWQRETLTGRPLETLVDHWRQRLGGLPPTLDLPFDRPRPARQSLRGASLSLGLGVDLTKRLGDLAQARGGTLFMAALAAFGALLGRWSGARDLALGTPVLGRDQRVLEPLVGMFINTLVMRVDASSSMTFHQLLEQVRETVLDAFEHQALPFEKLVEALDPVRSLSHAPLFQVFFELQTAPPGGPPLEGLTIEPAALTLETTRFDLNLSMEDGEEGLRGHLQYSTDLFDATTAQRLARSLERWIHRLVSSPHAPISRLSLLSAAERWQALGEHAAGSLLPSSGVDLGDRLLAALERRGDDEVLYSGDRRWSGFELAGRVRTLSRRLRARGVGTESLVAVCLPRGEDLWISLAAVLASGAAYLPLDPAHPQDRRRRILGDAGVGWVLGSPDLRQQTLDAGRIFLDPAAFSSAGTSSEGASFEAGTAGEASGAAAAPSAQNLAYVIYTSGSTGRPKGVQISRGALASFLAAVAGRLPLTPQDTLVAVTTVAFDISGLELFLPLLTGGRLVIADAAAAADGARLDALLTTCGATALQATPATWRMLLLSGWRGASSGRGVDGPADAPFKALCGGEALPRDLARELQQRGAEVWNLYGPTETTVWSGAKRVFAAQGPVSIGGPLPGTELLVLDRVAEATAVGTPGELWIAGPSLARGYRRRPAQTAAAFIPHPHPQRRGQRAYRTGDRVARLRDGRLRFLGRFDFQIKLRGYRIELGEIEACLSRLVEVERAAVLLRGEGEQARLVGYVVPSFGGGSNDGLEERLAESLRGALPTYMVPGVFVLLDELPLNASGKLDRRALPDPQLAEPAYVAPGTELEELVARVWAEVLGVARVGRGQDFFRLGGHSLLATRVVAKLRKELGVGLNLVDFFRHPTVEGVADALASLSARSEPPGERPDAAEALAARPPGAEAELSFAQRRLWFVHQLDPQGTDYNMHVSLDVRGALDPRALELSLERVVARHEALRTVFTAVDGRPVAAVREPAAVVLEVLEEGSEEAALRAAKAFVARPYDLAEEPPWRALLLRRGATHHHLVVGFHHIVFDGWSSDVFIHELLLTYAALGQGTGAGLEPLPVQYADYARWQRQRLEDGAMESALGWWQRHLESVETVLELPWDRPRERRRQPVGHRVEVNLGAASGALEALARSVSATPFVVLSALYELLLARLSGQTRFTVGTAVAGRTRTELEGMVGLFVNTLVLPVEIPWETDFATWLETVRGTTLAALDHQEVPFERVVDVVQPDRHLDRNPLFQAFFVYQRAGVDPLAGRAAREARGAGLEVEGWPLEEPTARFDLSLSLHRQESASASGGVFRGFLDYAEDLFQHTTALRWARALERLARTLVARPRRPLARISLLSAAERHQLLVEYGHRQRLLQCLEGSAALPHRRFEAEARRRPQAPAVTYEGQTLTYAELDAASNRLARRLRRDGAGPERVTALCLERNLDLVVAIVAVWKSGGAYLPLDPTLPDQRLSFMVEDGGASLLVTTQQHAGRCGRLRELLLDRDEAQIQREDPGALKALDEPQNLAYVLFTSGSTGRPKGCLLTRANVASLLAGSDRFYRFDDTDVWSLFHSYGFDISVWELWGALSWGGRLVVVPRSTIRSPRDFLALLARERVTVLNLTPSAFRQLVREEAELDAELDTEPDAAARDLAVRWVILGGEAVDLAATSAWLARHGDRSTVVNMYGITESTVHNTFRPLSRGDGERPWRSPVGEALDHLAVSVRDRHGNAVPMGVLGELWVRGGGIARGYLGRPALTAQRFGPDDGAGQRGTRAYRSGDLARWLADGELDYRSRIDHQIKIRGFRIELGEIQAAFEELPEISAAVVLARPGPGGEDRLVAWVVPAVEAEGVMAGAWRDELRSRLLSTLPEYMVPSFIVPLEAIPLTVNGKVDRRSLPAPTDAVGGSVVAPETPKERRLAKIWTELTGVESIGRGSEFFSVGGDSILAIQLVSRARREGLELSPRDVFEAPRLMDLALRCREIAAAVAGAEAGVLEGTLPLGPMPRWFLGADPRDAHHFNQGLMLTLAPAVPSARVAAAVERLLAHHDSLRLRFSRSEGRWTARYGAVSPQGAGGESFIVVDLAETAGAAGAERALSKVTATLQGGLDLESGPIFRAAELRLPGGQRRLLLVAHHLVVDGVSWRVLLEDLSTLLAPGAAAPLPPKTTSWRRWVEAQQAWCESEAARDSARRWRLLAPREEVVTVPLTCAAATVAESETLEEELDPATTEKLLRRVPARLHGRIQEILTAALALALVRTLRRGSAVCMEVEGHGRREELLEDVAPGMDVSRTVGWFTALYPVTVPGLGESSSVVEALARTKEALRSLPERGWSYGVLRYLRRQGLSGQELGGRELDADTAAPAQVLFNYLGRLDGSLGASRGRAGDSEPGPLAPAAESPGPMRAANQRRSHPLEVNSAIQGGKLKTLWSFAPGQLPREIVTALAQGFHRCLGELAAAAEELSRGAAALVLSDFPSLAQDPTGAAVEELQRLGWVEDAYPLAPLQEGLLADALRHRGSGLYIEQLRLELQGELDRDVLRWALGEVQRRHPALRTIFLWDGVETPFQVVMESAELRWTEHELPSSSSASSAAANNSAAMDALGTVAELAEARLREGFDLHRAPLSRFDLCRSSRRRWTLVWTFHHLILDGWSLPLLLREITAGYQAHRQGRAMAQPPARGYGDYVAWVRQQREDEARAFFTARLGELSEATPLGIDRASRAPLEMDSYRRVGIRLPQASAQAVAAAAGRLGLTVATLIHGAWALLLARYGGSRRVVVGSTSAGRSAPLAGIEERVGLFINTLPLSFEVAPDAPVTAWLQELQRELVGLRAFDFVPLSRIYGWSDVAAGSPLFESLVVVENYPMEEVGGVFQDLGLEVRSTELSERTGYPLTLVAAVEGGLTLAALYDRRRLKEPAVERLLRHLEILLEGMARELSASADTEAEAEARAVGAAGAKLGSLRHLATPERRQLVEGLGAPRGVQVPRLSPIRRFEEHARRQPDSPALTFGDSTLTYGELHAAAEGLAGQLRRQGVGPEVVVGLCLDSGMEQVTAILAVWKSGGAYLPLDSGLPDERLGYMVADAGARVVVTQREHGGRCGAPSEILVDGVDALLGAADVVVPIPSPRSAEEDPDHLAYVLFTSGSTGRPKGCLVTRGNVASLLAAAEAPFDFGPGDVWTLFHSYAFDFSVWELWGALAWGGHLVVVPAEVRRSPRTLLRLLVERGVTVLNLTPSAFRELVREEDEEISSQLTLRWVIFGGEALDVPSVATWMERHGEASPTLVNMYGITETTVHVTFRALTGEDGERPWRSPVGHPLDHLSVTVRDRDQWLCALGAPGELWVGGDGVARGYLGRPALTAARFVPDPLAGIAGARGYRSGDLGRRLEDGQLEHRGRMDHQVKIRGFRIELGEIQATLEAQEGVAAAVVAARPVPGGDGERLVAWWVPRAAASAVDGEALRERLAATLPAYMVPAVMVLIDGLPLTLQGKIDHRRLPQPAAAGGEGLSAPQTPAEALLVEVWKDLLSLAEAGRESDFFAAGGDSILAIQLVSRARRRGLELSPRDVFEEPRLMDLARCGRAAAVLPSAEQGELRGAVPLGPIQRWFLGAEAGSAPVDVHHYNQALLLTLSDAVESTALAAAVERLLTHHDALRLRFAATPNEGWSASYATVAETLASEPFSTVDLSATSAGPEAVQRTAAVVQGSLNLEGGPVFRAVELCLAPQHGRRLLLVAHHLVVDGVSWRVLLEDLDALLGSEEPATAPLPAKTSSWRRWVQALEAWGQSAEAQDSLRRWRQLTAQAEVAQLPLAVATAPVESSETLEVELDADTTEALLRRAPAQLRGRIQELLVSAVALAMARTLEAGSVALELEGHGRREELVSAVAPEVDLSRTVGWFTALFPVTVTGLAQVHAVTALARVKEALRAVPDDGVSYGVLRFLAGESPDPGGAAAGAVLFNYLGQIDSALGGPSRGAVRSLAAATEGVGPSRAGGQLRHHALEINSRVEQGRLRTGWGFSPNQLSPSTVQALADEYLSTLRALVAAVTDPRLRGEALVAADFPLLQQAEEALPALRSPGTVEDAYPLAPLQLGMLFHSLQDPSTAAYFQQLQGRIQGPLDLQLFQRCFQALARRHEVLRASFLWEGLRQPLQVVHREVTIPWTVLDLRGLPSPGQRSARWQDLLAADRRRGFDLTAAPLLRILLVLEDDGSRLLWSYHHGLFDGWSLPILLEELLTLYRLGESSVDPAVDLASQLPSPVPFSRYAQWLAKQDLEASREYWSRELAGRTGPTTLALPRPREGAAAGEPGALEPGVLRRGQLDHGQLDHGQLDHFLEPSSDRALKAFSKARSLTLATLLQGAWGLLLARYSGERDVVFGAVTAGRPADLEGVEGMVGPFINTLPLRLVAAPGERVGQWLDALQLHSLGQRQHEHSPLFEVQRWSGVPAGAALFQTLLVFENYPVSEALADEAQGSSVVMRDLQLLERTNYPLTLFVLPGERLSLRLDFHRQQFDETSMERMAGHLERLLAAMATAPEAPLDSLSMLAEAERRQLLETWNATAVEGIHHSSSLRRIQELALEAPQAPAVRFGDETRSRGELLQRAQRVARRLRAAGAGPQTLVAVCLHRGADLPAALLGVWMTSAAYLPLDPAYPAERLAFMLADAAAGSSLPVVLTQEALEDSLPPTPGARLLRLESLLRDAALELASTAAATVTTTTDFGAAPRWADELAYVIYTSGSTGRPKGTEISHGALLNFLASMAEAPGCNAADRWLAVTSLSFDIAGLELFLPLWVGAEVVVATAQEVTDGAALARRLESAEISILQATPVTWELLLAAGWRSPGAGRRGLRALCGGEALPADLARRLLEALGEAGSLWNLYGPTETTVWSATQRVHRESLAEGWVDLGGPIANTEIHLLGAGHEPVPVGVPGELYIGGAGLARGYGGRPALTAERFVVDPFCGRPGARLYRTGDLARRREDGTLAFIGRLDHQVKIRGLRIELGEIETTLEDLSAVRRCVALVREDRPGDRRLVAYLEPAPGASGAAGRAAAGADTGADIGVAVGAEERLETSRLREHCGRHLPEYMIPSHFVVVDRWPLTPNGKIDRRQLRPVAAAATSGSFVAPRSALERRLAALWQEVLGVDEIGVEESFFEAGGHSLLLLTVHGRLRQELGVELPVAEMFQFPTISQLAQRLSQEQRQEEQRQEQEDERIQRLKEGRRRLQRRRGRGRGERGDFR
ncbi:MAG: amino acid adenylation domain-containing protein [Acidobacteriota bacterium]